MIHNDLNEFLAEAGTGGSGSLGICASCLTMVYPEEHKLGHWYYWYEGWGGMLYERVGTPHTSRRPIHDRCWKDGDTIVFPWEDLR